MGICASCLGLNRHPSQDVSPSPPPAPIEGAYSTDCGLSQGDLDRILDSEQPTYGTLPDQSGISQPDEEELRREREALEHITSQATDHMIDVLHPSHADLNNNLTSSNYIHTSHLGGDAMVGSAAEQHGADMDAEEAAWLESIQAADTDNVQLSQKGALVMDIGLLRDGATQH